MSGGGVSAIRALLATCAVTRQDLEVTLLQAASGPQAPTHREFAVVAEAACSKGSRRTYRTTFRRLVAAFGDLPVDRVSQPDLATLAIQIRVAAALAAGWSRSTQTGFPTSSFGTRRKRSLFGHVSSSRIPVTAPTPLLSCTNRTHTR